MVIKLLSRGKKDRREGGKSIQITYHCIYDYNKVCEVTMCGKYTITSRDKLFDVLALMDLNQPDEMLLEQMKFYYL